MMRGGLARFLIVVTLAWTFPAWSAEPVASSTTAELPTSNAVAEPTANPAAAESPTSKAAAEPPTSNAAAGPPASQTATEPSASPVAVESMARKAAAESMANPTTEPPASHRAVERVRRDLAAQAREYQKVLRSLRNINREMKRFVEERSTLDQERILTEAQLKTISDKTSKIQIQLESQRALLLSKLSSIRKFDQQVWLSFLLRAKNSAQLERNMKILGLIGQRDVQAMKDYSRLARDLDRQKAQFTDRLAYLNGLRSKIHEMENGLREQTELRGQLLSSMKVRQRRTIEKLRRLRESQAPAEALAESGILDALLEGSFAERKGRLIAPVEGAVTRNYGVIRDNEHHLILSHRGWMYESALHAPVRAVHDGQIAHKGFFPEYGNFVIVDHADHYYSVYAMLARTELRTGDQVKEGQTLGQAGVNPFDGRPGLYFEIRHFAETMDPKAWMKGKGYEISNLEWDR